METNKIATLLRHYVTSELRLLEVLQQSRDQADAEYAWDAVVSGLILAGFLDAKTFQPLLYNPETVLMQSSENRDGAL